MERGGGMISSQRKCYGKVVVDDGVPYDSGTIFASQHVLICRLRLHLRENRRPQYSQPCAVVGILITDAVEELCCNTHVAPPYGPRSAVTER